MNQEYEGDEVCGCKNGIEAAVAIIVDNLVNESWTMIEELHGWEDGYSEGQSLLVDRWVGSDDLDDSEVQSLLMDKYDVESTGGCYHGLQSLPVDKYDEESTGGTNYLEVQSLLMDKYDVESTGGSYSDVQSLPVDEYVEGSTGGNGHLGVQSLQEGKNVGIVKTTLYGINEED